MRISAVRCARTPNLEIAFSSGNFLPAGGASPWRRQDGNGAILDFALAKSPKSKVCGDEGEVAGDSPSEGFKRPSCPFGTPSLAQGGQSK